ncbi:hypothetical protein E4U41_003882 [Claviceps citrina]|nr:hypothetical protein E4U41_003882 [Claviceps citrina]
MKFAAALIAAAVGVAASSNGTYTNGTVVTEVVDKYVTYCPHAGDVVHGNVTYHVTKPMLLTITNCPCTITRQVYTTSSVECHDCTAAGSQATANPDLPVVTPTGGVMVTPTTGVPSSLPTGGAGKAAALSGAGLAGIVGLAALVL